MNTAPRYSKLFSWLFLSTGDFAILGALYSWGEGPLLAQQELNLVLIPWADLLVTGPLSLLAALGLLRRRPWGTVLSLLSCGIYLFGSALVYISLAWQGPPYPLHLAFPPLLGIALGICFPLWVCHSLGCWRAANRGQDCPVLQGILGSTSPAKGLVRPEP